MMKISPTMDLKSLMGLMGSVATVENAGVLRGLLADHALYDGEDTAEIDEDNWLAMVNLAVDPLTPSDEPLVCEWLNCETASVDARGDVWVEGPMTGHWLKPERLIEFSKWRNYRRKYP